jgi:hypothetical protein
LLVGQVDDDNLREGFLEMTAGEGRDEDENAGASTTPTARKNKQCPCSKRDMMRGRKRMEDANLE